MGETSFKLAREELSDGEIKLNFAFDAHGVNLHSDFG